MLRIRSALRSAACAAVTTALAAASRTAAADAPTMDPPLSAALSSTPASTQLQVIVRLSGAPTLPRQHVGDRHAARRALLDPLRSSTQSQLRLLEPMLSRISSHKPASLWIIHAVKVSSNPAGILEILSHPGVASVHLDAVLPAPRSNDVQSSGTWNLDAIQAPQVWSRGYTGVNVVVASLDTGVDFHHADLVGSWRGGSNSWFDPSGEHATPFDTEGHGTRTLGIIVGGAATGMAMGVAPGARWIAAKIYNDQKVTTVSAVHETFQWVLDPDGDPGTDDAPDVVNNSWGFNDHPGECLTEFAEDLDLLHASGIAVVFSAGNDGPAPATSVSPANYAGVLSVGSVDDALSIQDESSRGPSACGGGSFPSVVAPGVNVRTADLTYGGVFPQSTAYVSGTSFAAPHITGAIALLMSAFPSCSASDVERAIVQSATALGPGGANDDYGAGLVAIDDAFQLLSLPDACSSEADAGVDDAASDSPAPAEPEAGDADAASEDSADGYPDEPAQDLDAGAVLDHDAESEADGVQAPGVPAATTTQGSAGACSMVGSTSTGVDAPGLLAGLWMGLAAMLRRVTRRIRGEEPIEARGDGR